MRATRLKLHNALGFDDVDIQLGKVTILHGENDTGKSSLIGALQAACESGSDSTLLRTGTEKGEILLILDNGDVSITRKLTLAGAKPPAIRRKDGGPVTRYRPFLDQLTDVVAINPTILLNEAIPIKHRIEWLKEVIAPELDRDSVRQAASVLEPAPDEQELEGPAFDVLARVREEVYELRHSVNAQGKSAGLAAERLAEGLPVDYGTDWAAETERLEGESDKIATKLEAKRGEIDTAKGDKLNQARADYEAEVDRINKEAQNDYAVATQFLQKEKETAIGALAEARAKAEEQQRASVIREEIETNRAAAEKAATRSGALSAAMRKLDEIKSKLLSSLPIKGLEIRENNVFLDDIPFDRVNKARRVGIALQASVIRAKKRDVKLKLICLDDAEHLTKKTFAQLERAALELAEKHGFQFVIARAESEPDDWPKDKPYLRVETQ